MSYNGWKNRETWLVNLYFGDDIIEYVYEAGFNPEKWAISDIADAYKEYVFSCIEEEIENLSPFIRDLINLDMVDWYTLAKNIYEEEQWREA